MKLKQTIGSLFINDALSDLINTRGTFAPIKFSLTRKHLACSSYVFSACTGVLALIVLSYFCLFESLPGYQSGLTGFKIGPLPKHQMDIPYDFTKVKKTFGELPVKYLHRGDELDADQFKTLILTSVPRGLRSRLEKNIASALFYAKRYELDPFWVLSIMWTESHFNYRAKSYVAAKGLMQIMPLTGHFLMRRIGRPISMEVSQQLIGDPTVNIELGTFYLKQLLNKFNGSHLLATVAYNMGPGYVNSRLRRGRPVGNRNIYLNKVNRAYKKIVQNYNSYMEALAPAFHWTLVASPTFSQVLISLREQTQFLVEDVFFGFEWVSPPYGHETAFHIASSEVFL